MYTVGIVSEPTRPRWMETEAPKYQGRRRWSCATWEDAIRRFTEVAVALQEQGWQPPYAVGSGPYCGVSPRSRDRHLHLRPPDQQGLGIRVYLASPTP